MVSDAEYRDATRRGREMRKHVPHAISAHYDERLKRVFVRLSNRLEIALNPADHQTLHQATAEQLSEIELWGAGYELFFPKLDDGVYVPSLIQGILGSKRWMEEQAAGERKEFATQRKTFARKRAGSMAA